MYAVKFIYLSRGNFHTSHTKLNVSKNLLIKQRIWREKNQCTSVDPKTLILSLSLEKLVHVLQKYYNKDGCILQIALLSIADTLSIKGRPCTQ